MYNEIFPPFTEKQSRVEANERSVYQLVELYSEDSRGNPKSYKVSAKSHSNLLPKRCIPLYLEEIKFAILRCGWKVTKLYKHYYFDQERFKRDFILMNQKSRQQAANKIESGFFKLLNNANFGYDCRKSLDSCTFEPINDEIGEQEIDERFNNEKQKIKESDPFYCAKIRSLDNRRSAENEALERFKEKEKKQHKKSNLNPFVDRMDNAVKNSKVTTITDFSDQDTASIKALGVKTNDKVKITTRFIKGKMLMFSKMSIKSFVYDLIDIFCYPDEEVKEIYAKHDIIKGFIYLILTDTGSCSIQFLFLTRLSSQISEEINV